MRGIVAKRLKQAASLLVPKHPDVVYEWKERGKHPIKHQLVLGVCKRNVYKELKRRYASD